MLAPLASSRPQTRPAIGQPDSLLRILLRTEPLQTNLSLALIQRLITLSASADSSATAASSPEISVGLKIISHLRWLDAVFDPPTVARALLEATSMLAPPLQIEAISALPSIGGDCCDEALLRDLVSLTECNAGK